MRQQANMGITKLDQINATTSKAKINAGTISAPATYYGSTSGQDVSGLEWKGGELLYNSSNDKLYVQTATSGTTATWRYLDDAFATTSTTSTSTSTSTTSSTSTSSSSSTSTSTSSSSSTSTSTSTSSTTTSG